MSELLEQPIETAPRDGTVVIVWNSESGPTTAFYDRRAGGFWASNSGDCMELDFEPTHWTPIPNFTR